METQHNISQNDKTDKTTHTSQLKLNRQGVWHEPRALKNHIRWALYGHLFGTQFQKFKESERSIETKS